VAEQQPPQDEAERAERALLEDEALRKRLRELDRALKQKRAEREQA
jgi:hypothetical protein